MASKAKTMTKVIKSMKNWPTYLQDYLGMKKRRLLTYKLRDGTKVFVRGGSTDRFIFNEIWIHKSYTPKGFEIKATDTVVDIGAHAGIFTTYAAKQAKKGKVYSFEPAKENYNLLEKNVKENNLQNVHIYNKAVSKDNKPLTFYISSTKNKGQNSIYNIAPGQKKIQIQAESMKGLIKRLGKIDFLKMDCEGAEYDIFPSLTKKELTNIKKISMEYHNYNGKHGSTIREILEKNGYKVWMLPEGKKFGTIYAKLQP